MRSAEDLRQRWLDRLPMLVTWPGMWATTGQGFDVQARGLLGDLCYLDGRDADYDMVAKVLGAFGKLGVAGPFMAVFPKEHRCVDEVASVYAEQFHQLGYLPVDRLLDKAEWDLLNAGLRSRFDGQDVRRSEAERLFGPPSLVIGKRILCYATASGPGWIFFDCFTGAPVRYVAGREVMKANLTETHLSALCDYRLPTLKLG